MDKRQKLLALRLSCAHYYARRCYVCQAQISDGYGFTYHHLWYLPTEKKYKDFKDPVEYYEYLTKKIKKNPKRFLLLCNKHHQAVERLNRFKGGNFERVVKAARMTKT